MKLTGFLAISAFLMSISAASAEPITLQDAVARALEYDPAIEQAAANIERSEAGIDQALAKRRPTAGIRGELGLLETDFTADTISQIPRSVGLQAEWTVFSSGATNAAIDASQFQRDAAARQLLSSRERIALNTFEAYARTWLAEQVTVVAKARVDTLSTRLEETNSRFEQGLVTRTDIALTEARLASAEAQYEAARAGVAAARAQLARLTGETRPEPIGPASFSYPDIGSLDAMLGRVLTNNPDLAAAQSALSSADARVKEASAQFGPKVSVRARATHGEDMFFFFEDPISDIGAFVTVEMPLYTGGMKQAAARGSIASKSLATAQLRQVRLQLTQATTSLWENISARRLALNAAQRAEAAASLAAEGSLKEYDAGLRTLVDTLDAENEYRDAELQSLRAETELRIAEAQLLSLSSELEAALLP